MYSLHDSPLINSALNNGDFLKNNSERFIYTILKEVKDTIPNAELSNEGLSFLNHYNIKEVDFDALSNDEITKQVFDQEYNLSIEHLTQKTDTFLIHGFSNFRPVDNSPTIEKLSLKNRVDIIRSYNPDLSCSTFNNGIRHDSSDFGNAMVGVIISSGIINSASTTDDGSYVDAKGKRKSFGMAEQDQIEIETIMKSRHDIGVYNEIVISDPEIAGVYLKLDAPRQERDGIEVDFKSHFKPDKLSKIHNTLNSCIHQNYDKPLPMLAIINGEVREMNININEINTYLPSYNGQKVDDVHDYDSVVLREYESKMELWNKMSDSDFFDKIITLGKPLTQKELSIMGRENKLNEEEQLKIVQKNQKIVKNNLSENRINELTSIIEEKQQPTDTEYINKPPKMQKTYNNKKIVY